MKIKRTLVFILTLSAIALPIPAFAAGISVSGGGGTKYVGDDVSLSITASGSTFNAFSGTISVSGPMKIISCSPSKALWVKEPSSTGDFAGALTDSTSSFKISTCKVRGTGVGTGRLSISSVKLANKGEIVGSNGSSASITFERRPTPPGTITVTSQSHPDPNSAYETTTIMLNWDRPANVTGFSYLLDQKADTTPPEKVTNNEAAATYENQAVGVYYFHIRAINGDGWGPTTHFAINIKEPDPKVKDILNKPKDISVKKAKEFIDDPIEGTFAGILISGQTEPGYTANIKLDPMPTLPENKLLSTLADSSGHFELLIDFPIKGGFYKLTVQGQSDKILTPLSDPINFEINLAKGGSVITLTADDANEPVIPPAPAKKWYEKINYFVVTLILLPLFLICLILLIRFFAKNKKDWKNLAEEISLKKLKN